MRPSSTLLLSLALGAVLPAYASLDNTSTVYTPPPSSQSCPVGFSVKRNPNSGLILVKERRSLLSQGLQLDFTRPQVAITRAFVTVHGAIPSTRMLPTLSRQPSGHDAIETFVLTPGSNESFIWTEKMSAITWVELTRLEYTDGTSWEASAQSRCSAAPSLFVLVNSGAERP